MKILIACEESQAVCKEMRRLGHEAYSCDIIECSGGHPEWHIKGDVLPLIDGDCHFATMDGSKHTIVGEWDMLIAFPPCTYLTCAGNAHINRPGRREMREEAACFFMQFVNAKCRRVAIENPVGYMNSYYRRSDQTIHPYYFAASEGDEENYQMKRTCLWLKNLKPLKYAKRLPKPKPYSITYRTDGTQKKRYFVDAMTNNKARAKNRSKTFPGIARAMAEQWAGQAEK